jgi:hypothetical protein
MAIANSWQSRWQPMAPPIRRGTCNPVDHNAKSARVAAAGSSSLSPEVETPLGALVVGNLTHTLP